MNKETHDAYVEFVKLRDADKIIEHEKDLKENWPENDSTFYDIKGNQISYGLFSCLMDDLVYCVLKESYANNFEVYTTWSPCRTFPKMFRTSVLDRINRKSCQERYYSEKDALEGHDNFMKLIEAENFIITWEMENKHSRSIITGSYPKLTHQDCN